MIKALVLKRSCFNHPSRALIPLIHWKLYIKYHNSMLSCARFANRRETLSYKLCRKIYEKNLNKHRWDKTATKAAIGVGSRWPSYPRHSPHGSLEGVRGLKTNEAYHSKVDAMLIPEM